MNLRWWSESHQQWDWIERDLPANPPGAYFAEGDVMMDSISILNWTDGDDVVFEPRLRDNVQEVSRVRLVLDDATPEIDVEYDCE